MGKRFLSLILGIAMCVTLVPMMLFAGTYEEYDVWVNGEQFTSEKPVIECGDGTATYDNGRVVLENATITYAHYVDSKAYGIYATSSLDISVIGTNTISIDKDDPTCGICVECKEGWSLNIYGREESVLNINVGSHNKDKSEAYAIYSNSNIKFSNISVNCNSTINGIGTLGTLYIDRDARVISSALNGKAIDCGAFSFWNVNKNEFEVNVSENSNGTNAKIWDEVTDLKAYSYVSILPDEYYVWVNGERFTRTKSVIDCGDGTATYDADKHELTLNNATITNVFEKHGAIYSCHPIDIVLEGDNVINLPEEINEFGVHVEGDLTVKGAGNFDITTDVDGNYDGIWATKTLTIDMEGDLTILAGGECLQCNEVAGKGITLAGSGDINLRSGNYGMHTDGDAHITTSGDIDIIAGYGRTVTPDPIFNPKYPDGPIGIYAQRGMLFENSGNITIEALGNGIDGTTGNMYFMGSGDIDVQAGKWGLNNYKDVYFNASGDIHVVGKQRGMYGAGCFYFGGTGDIYIEALDEHAVYTQLYGSETERRGYSAEIFIEGSNNEITFKSGGGYPASWFPELHTVGGSTLSEYEQYGTLFDRTVRFVHKDLLYSHDDLGRVLEMIKKILDENGCVIRPTDPTADGYTFDDWYYDEDGTEPVDFNEPDEGEKIFAVWLCDEHTEEIRDAKEATCTEDGYTGDTYCVVCGHKLEEGEIIPATGHVWDTDFTVDKEATLTEEGSKSIHCTKCDEKKDVTAIPTLEPTGEPTPSPKPSGEPTPTSEPTPSVTPSGEPTPTNEPTTEPTPTAAPELDVSDFIDRCYEVALGREADEAGLDYWVDGLNNGELCGAQAVYGFIFSEEYINKNRTNEEFVNDMYAMYFGREADEAGFNYWVEQLNNEIATREDIMAGFANSEEFFNLCGKYGVVCGTYVVGVPNDMQGGVNCFVARLYKVCLNRLPDQGGQAGWVQMLINGEVTGSTCAYGFVFSEEFTNLNLDNTDFVKYMYNAFFGREADEDGLNYWVEQLNAGTATREDVFAGFSGSAEFANLCSNYGIIA